MPVRYARRDPPPPEPEAEEGPEGLPVPARPRPPPRDPPPRRRSHAAAFVAVVLVVLGVYLAAWSLLVPLLLALLLLSTGLTFLGTRLNPLSVGFYLTVKPSWSSIAILFLSGAFLLDVAFSYWKHGWGPILPAHLVPW
ncbi:MAG: hypothetical protein ACYDFT_09030 [Thermoplasmata archaeon]